jgi:serine/threonine-protein kinase
MSPAAHTILSNRYALTERIAAGGMSEVWAAIDTILGRAVAVKLLSPALSQQSEFPERLRAEARCFAALHHPNITTVFDYGEDGGSACLVMEFVAGQPLSQIISEHAPLSAQTTASTPIQAATALAAAHQGGVVHRDVKPANILITPDVTAKLTDFGISRLVNSAPLTQTGQVLGTARYLCLEQVMGQTATASSDIYALGVVGHEMLTGQRPFDGETLEATAFAHLRQLAPKLHDTVTLGIRAVNSAALSKEQADRPATAAAMAHGLGIPDVPFTPGAPAAGGLALPAEALPQRTQAATWRAMPAPTQAMPPRATPTEPRGMPDRGPQLRPAWLLAGAAAGALVVLAACALPDSGGATQTPVATTATSPTLNQNGETPSNGETTEVARSADNSSMPGQPT